jgi:hypothetical protein
MRWLLPILIRIRGCCIRTGMKLAEDLWCVQSRISEKGVTQWCDCHGGRRIFYLCSLFFLIVVRSTCYSRVTWVYSAALLVLEWSSIESLLSPASSVLSFCKRSLERKRARHTDPPSSSPQCLCPSSSSSRQ